MLSYITMPIRILLSALLLGNPHANTISASPTDTQLARENLIIGIDSQFETESGTYYEAVLKDPGSGKVLGRVLFSYDKFAKSGYIARLHVQPEERKQSYGSSLLKFALQKLTDLKCIGIYWQAYPFDLRADQTSQNMLPKLIAFYKRHGAQVLSQNETSAQMAYYPPITAQVA